MLDGEPRLENYFNRIIPPTADLPDPSQVEFQYDARGFEDGVKVRADLAVQMTDLANDLIIDFTFVEPTARTYGAYNKAGQAALKGKEKKIKSEYKHWNVLGDNVTNQFYIVAVETFGIILKEDITHIFRTFINPKENSTQVLHLLTQQLSVAVHTIRAIQFESIKGVQVFEERRIQPTINRNRSGRSLLRAAVN